MCSRIKAKISLMHSCKFYFCNIWSRFRDVEHGLCKSNSDDSVGFWRFGDRYYVIECLISYAACVYRTSVAVSLTLHMTGDTELYGNVNDQHPDSDMYGNLSLVTACILISKHGSCVS